MKFGILGCARIARRAVIKAIQNAPSARLLAIASRRGQTAADWAAEFGIPRHYDSYETLIADPDIDAVYIPLPNELHQPWVLAAAATGKHVLCEKPLGVDLADAEAMVDGCRRRGVLLMEAFMWRHHPRVAHARRLLAEGKLGQLRLIKMDFSFLIDPSDWRLEPQRGAGALYDLGCYGINAARLFAGSEPQEVFARAHYHDSGADLTTGLLLEFSGDVLGLVDCSFECPRRNRLEVVGSAGALEFPQGVLPPEESMLIFRGPPGEEVFKFAAADQYAQQIEAFCASVAAGRLIEPAEDGLANMCVVEQVRVAAAKGRR